MFTAMSKREQLCQPVSDFVTAWSPEEGLRKQRCLPQPAAAQALFGRSLRRIIH